MSHRITKIPYGCAFISTQPDNQDSIHYSNGDFLPRYSKGISVEDPVNHNGALIAPYFLDILGGQTRKVYLYVQWVEQHLILLPGFPAPRKEPKNLKGYQNDPWEFVLRTERAAHPLVINIGDTLIDGRTVISLPRVGNDRQILLHLSNGSDSDWFLVAESIPIALR